MPSGVAAPADGGPSDRFRGIRWLATTTAVATLVLIAMGGAVRATDSGLACPDWPACYGQWIPPADLNMWLEHSHRLWAGVVGLGVLWLSIWTLLRARERRVLWLLSLAALVLILVQAGLGAAVVLLHLRAGLVTSHLGMSLVVVGCLTLIAVLARDPAAAGPPGVAGTDMRRLGRWAGWTAALVFGQALLGGQATGRGAAYVFNALPIWLAPDAWTGHVREVLHVTHRFAGYLVAVVVIAFAVAARRRWRAAGRQPAWLGSLPALAAALVVVQVGLGIANVLTRASVASAIAHLAVASWLWTALVLIAALGLAERAHRPRPAGDRDRPAGDPAAATVEEVHR